MTIDGGFWGPRITLNAETTVPHNIEFLEKTDRLAVFDRAAGVEEGDSDDTKMAVDSDVFSPRALTVRLAAALSAAISIAHAMHLLNKLTCRHVTSRPCT